MFLGLKLSHADVDEEEEEEKQVYKLERDISLALKTNNTTVFFAFQIKRFFFLKNVLSNFYELKSFVSNAFITIIFDILEVDTF